MTLVFAQYPALWLLLLLSALLSVFSVRLKRGGVLLTASAVLCVVAMVILALACSVPYVELLLLLLVPLLACFLAMGKGDGQ